MGAEVLGSVQGGATVNHDDLGNYSHTYVKGIKDSLAASQADNARLREAVEYYRDTAICQADHDVAADALSQPTNDSTLLELKAELEELRFFKEQHTYKRKRLEDAGFGKSPLREDK